MNQDIYNELKPPGIVTVVKVRRFEWLGRIVRLDCERAVNRVLKGTPRGRREKRKCQFKVDG
jgi:hypothetical protein